MVLSRATRFGVSLTASDGVSEVPDSEPSHPRNTQPLAALRVTGRVLPCVYQPEGSLGSEMAPTQLGMVGTGSLTDPVATDLSQGDVRQTGNELDMALVGPGFEIAGKFLGGLGFAAIAIGLYRWILHLAPARAQ